MLNSEVKVAKTKQKQGKTGKKERDTQPKLLDYLDKMINGYYEKTNAWPGRIIFSQETKDKIFAELEQEPTMDLSWKDYMGNYRGIRIEIKEGIFIDLKGD